MLKFERLDGPCGIPVFYQYVPEIVKSSGIALAVFTGGADDTSVGEPGTYHWFEHVPFRGTKKFPDGYLAVKGPVARVGGKIGAWTSKFCTNYWATLPTRHLSIGMDVVVDLVARPILANEAIIAEREIINQEIRDRLGSANGILGYHLHSILWDDHPLASPVLGSAESLGSMTPELLRKARGVGYDRSRMAFFVSTALPKNEILDMVSNRFETLPSNGVGERRMGASFGLLPWAPGVRTEIETEFSSAVVKVLFRLSPLQIKRDFVKRALLIRVFSHGGLGSPLYRAVREDNQLAYSASMESYATRDGGYWGFHVNTSPKNVGAVERALSTMLHDPQLRSQQWFEDIKEAGRCSTEMEVINPSNLVEGAVRQTTLMGEPVMEEEMIEIANSITQEEILETIDEIHFEDARTIVAFGK